MTSCSPATLEYIDWFNHRRPHCHGGNIPPVEFENEQHGQIADLIDKHPAEPRLR